MRIERVAAPEGMTIDDGDATGFSAPNWTKSNLQGYDGDSRYGYGGTATYNFTGLAPGNYRVLAQWPGHKEGSSNAAYRVTSGSNAVETSVDQRTGTQGWQELTRITVSEGLDAIQVVVSQGEGGIGAIRADAIRVESTDTFFDRYERELLATLSPPQQTADGGGATGF